MGERLNISLDKGVHRTPTIGEEGQLSECVNMIPRNGQLTPLRAPSEHYHYVSDRYHLIYIHENAGYKHYIHAVELTDNIFKLYWSDDDPAGEIGVGDMTELTGITVGSLDNIYHISHIGNTVIFLTDSGVKMQVFKGNAYKYLSGQIPELDISFGLNTWLDWLGEETAFLDDLDSGWSNNDELQNINNSFVDNVNEIVKAKRNSLISDANKNGYWTFPFFVRYALAMKDGSLIHCSAPVLMTPCTDNPLCTCRQTHSIGTAAVITDFFIDIVKAKLKMHITAEQLEQLMEYDDIIQGVAIYASEQIWTYNQDGKYTQGRYAYSGDKTQLQPLNYQGGVSFGEFQQVDTEHQGLNVGSEPSSVADLMYYKGVLEDEGSAIQINDIILENPKRPAADIDKEIKECSNFYLLKSYTLDELSSMEGEWNEITFTSNRIPNISSYQRMEDEMELRDNYISKVGYTYNRRLNIANSTYKINNPLGFTTLINYIEWAGRVNTFKASNEYPNTTVTPGTPTESKDRWSQKIQINDNGQIRIVSNDNKFYSGPSGAFYYIAVPMSGADKIWAYNNDRDEIIQLPLARHEFLNTSYHYQGFGEVIHKGDYDIPDDKNDNLYSNSLRVSLPENPWVFPDYLKHNVGNGQIISMAAAIKALSVGQYGQFPLVVFATDGIWTLQINDDGTYKPATFLSGDVCTNPASITQTDSAVLFVTKQGLKVVDGSDVRLLSLPIEGNNIPDGTFIPTNSSAAAWADIVIDESVDKRLSLQNCNCLFDYTDRLLHIFNDDKKHDCMTLESGDFASEVNRVVSYSHWSDPIDFECELDISVGEWVGENEPVEFFAPDILIDQSGEINFIKEDKITTRNISFIWSWLLNGGVLRTENETIGGPTHIIKKVELFVDFSLIDNLGEEIKNFKQQFAIYNESGINVSGKVHNIIIDAGDADYYLIHSGDMRFSFNSMKFKITTDGNITEGEYFAPELSFESSFRYHKLYREQTISQLDKPSRIIARNPESLFQVGSSVFSYAGYDPDASSRLGYLITRPIAFGDFTKFKTILDMRLYDQVADRGSRAVAADNGCWVVLWASNDETHWFRINSLHGNSFKFFRIAIITRLGKDDTLSGLSIEYEERRGTKMR